MLHLPQFEPIWVVMHMDRPSVQVRHAIKQQFLGWLEQLWGSCGVFSGRLAGAWKSPAPHAARVCGQNCFADDFAVLIIAAIILASVFLYNQRMQWQVKVHFVHLCLQRSTHTALNRFSLFAFVSAAANDFKGRVQPSGNKHLIHLSGLIWWKCQNTIFTYGEISSDMLFWCFNKQFKSGERLQHWHYLCG